MALTEKRRDQIVDEFVRVFGYRPTSEQVQEISDRMDAMPSNRLLLLEDAMEPGGLTGRADRQRIDHFFREEFSDLALANVESSEISRIRNRTDIAPALTAQENATQAGGIEQETGYEFARDEDGNIVTDQFGGFVLAGNPDQVFDPAFGTLRAAIYPEEEEGPAPIGVPEDFAVRDFALEEALQRRGPANEPEYTNLRGKEYEAKYFEWDQWRQFSTKNPEYQTEVQQALIAAGLMNEKDYVPGTWTVDAARAMELAMFEANASASTWDRILRDRAQGREEAGLDDDDAARSAVANRRLVLPTFREPDYASLSQNVKTLFRNQLGRDPLDWEVKLLADQLNTDFRSQYDAEAAALTQEFEAGNRIILQQEDQDGPVVGSGGTVQGVDPVARLRERFEQKYGNELELNQDRIDERQQLGNVFNILTQTSRLMSSGAQ